MQNLPADGATATKYEKVASNKRVDKFYFQLC
jgi:hypothetical protein